MNTNQVQNNTSPLYGNLLRLGDRREIAIYLRDGAAWVAEFKDGKNGRGKVFSMSEWFSLNQGGRVLRGMALDTITPLPTDVAERIERVHRRLDQANNNPVMPQALATLVAGFCGRLARLLQVAFAPKSAQQHYYGPH